MSRAREHLPRDNAHMQSRADPTQFRPARETDWPAIWTIISEVIATGDTYPYPPDMDQSAGRSAWMQEGGRGQTYVALYDGEIVGTAYLKPNQPGLGDHVANAGWMLSSSSRGRGLGRKFAEFVIDDARVRGFTGMQFNAVVSTNRKAIDLWRSLGFEIVGTVPDAFRHSEHGPVAIHVMYRAL